MRRRTTRQHPPRSPHKPAAGVEFGWKVHAAIQDCIRGVDTKASLTLAAITVLAVFAGNQVYGDKGSLNPPLDGIPFWAVRVFAGAFGLAFVCALLAVIPHLRAKRAKVHASTGLIFFGHLRYRKEADIVAELKELDEDEIIRQLGSQLDVTSDIAWRKHRYLQASHWFLAVAVASLVLALTAP